MLRCRQSGLPIAPRHNLFAFWIAMTTAKRTSAPIDRQVDTAVAAAKPPATTRFRATNKAAEGPGRRQLLAVNMPAATVQTRLQMQDDPPDLRLPHERDQSAVDITAPAPDPMMVQAAKDLAAGLVDTDLHNQPGLDAERQRALLRRAR